MSHAAIDSALLIGTAEDGKYNSYRLVIPGGHHTFGFEWAPNEDGLVEHNGLGFIYEHTGAAKVTVVTTLQTDRNSVAVFDKVVGRQVTGYRQKLETALETELKGRMLHGDPREPEAPIEIRTSVPLVAGVALFVERIRDRLHRLEPTTE